jgi:predicted membrane protein
MEYKDIKDETKDPPKDREEKPHGRKGRIWGGLFFVLVGGALLLEKLGVFFPYWLFTWPMILILIGLFVGIKHNFRSFGWLIPIAIGGIFLAQEIFTNLDIDRLVWPVVLIVIGLSFMLSRNKEYCFGGPHRHHRLKRKLREKWGEDWQEKWAHAQKERAYWHDWKKQMYDPGYTTSSGDLLDVNAVFGSVKKTVLSKNFKGGEVNTVMGGCELNLTQADIVGRAEIEVNTVFGGTRIIVPPNWQVHSDMDSVFGSMEDKRPIQLLNPDPNKLLVIRGTAVFGGTELSLG